MDNCKPIAVMYFPLDFTLGPSYKIIDPLELTRELNGWDSRVDQFDGLRGYLWFCFFKPGIQAPELQVFHPKDFTDIQYQELKDLVMKELNKSKLK